MRIRCAALMLFVACRARQPTALPGAPPFDETLAAKLASAWAHRDPGYRPRTRHLRADGAPLYTNRLFLESSPYLRQHAHNPVNWYPWGDEAFETARRLGRSVLLSVGYSTCHWCHVMEEESFEDEALARYLNENYVAIKVDREERPDVDAVYMQAVQMMTGRGGWPMTVWLTSERKPFYGGTFFPRDEFAALLSERLTDFRERPREIADQSARIVASVRAEEKAPNPTLPGIDVLDRATQLYRQLFDWQNGGRRGAPKFPSSMPIRFLLRRHELAMATLTLEKMAAGGIHDHVGGGFHRYSTDPRWLVPHFEKMLYDNALLARDYLEAFQATGRADFARVARGILRWADRDMSSPEGGFYSASDADSLAPDGTRKEGWFFTWTPTELEATLGKNRATAVATYYGVTAEGNFEGRNILSIQKPFQPPPEEVLDELYAARAKRPAPLRDEKTLASWNGLMMGAFAQAALVLEDPAYAARAEKAADFVLVHLRKHGRLVRAAGDAYLDDYAFVIAGLIDLFEATGRVRWLEEAIALDRVLEQHYEDRQHGGFFLTADDHEALLAREKPSYDAAEPSGNSIEVLNLIRLFELTTDDRYRRRAENTLGAFGDRLSQRSGLPEMLISLDFYSSSPKEIVIVTRSSRNDAAPLLAKLATNFVPNHVLAVATQGADLESQAKLVPLLRDKIAREGKATAYVCQARVCALPTSDPAVFAAQLRTPSPK
jgi:uncharacterized protein YyaL (SSP411 family)